MVYPSSYVPPDPAQTEEMVQEDLRTVMLLDNDGDGVYTALERFDEAGAYRVVVYAVDGDGLHARHGLASGTIALLSWVHFSLGQIFP